MYIDVITENRKNKIVRYKRASTAREIMYGGAKIDVVGFLNPALK